jgi:hypothetical protein
MMSRDLPQFPNFEHLKKQAKAVLRKLRTANPAARLTQAQLVIARQYGFESWPKLKSHLESAARPESGPPAAGHFSRYTEEVRRAIFFARYWAAKHGSLRIENEHLLLGLADADAAFLNRIRPAAGESVRQHVARRTRPLEARSRYESIPLSEACRHTLDLAAAEADRLHHNHVATGHFLLAFLRDEESPASAIVSEVLADRGMHPGAARNNIIRLLNDQGL